MRNTWRISVRAAASTIALLIVCVPMTVGAILAFPLFDDAWLWLLLKESGPALIRPSVADRPVMAALWWLLAGSETGLWWASFAAQALLWPILGMSTALLWNYLCPGLRRYAMVVACVAVAPMLSNVQMVTTTIALGPLLSVVLGYVAFLLVLRFVTVEGHLGWAALATSVPVLGLGMLVTEYAIPVVPIMLIVLWLHGRLAADPETKRRSWQAIVLVAVVASVGYLVYLLLTDRGARPGSEADPADPSYMLTLGVRGLIRFPFNLFSGGWQLLGSGFLTTMAETSITSVSMLLAVMYGTLVAGLLLYGDRAGHRGDAAPGEAIQGRRLVLLLAIFAVGLAPIVAMARVPWNPGDAMSSRFALPLLPITATVLVLGSLSLVRPRLWTVPILVLGFSAGYGAFTEAWSAIAERRQLTALGAALQSHVESTANYTIAAVALPERSLGPRRPYELTARLAADWPADLRQRFWAYRFEGGPPTYQLEQEAQTIFGSRGSCKPTRTFKLGVRLVGREGPLGQLLWVAPRPDGSIAIEPYCLRDRNHR